MVGPFDEAKARRTLRLGIGALWVLDGFLQLQPVMFTRALVVAIWRPMLQGQPGWLAALIGWSIRLASPHLIAFNVSLALTQVAIGALMLTREGRAARVGLWWSAVFAAAVWVFGEGMGQVLAPGATILAGAPGSALVYLAASVLLLLPAGSWRPTAGRPAAAPALLAGGVFVLCGLLQLQPTFWTSLGLAAPFGQAFMMPQPPLLRQIIGATSGVVANAPVALNALFSAALVGCGLLLSFGAAERRPALTWAALAVLGAVWLLGQDVGMLFSGMATDPNSAPALALFLGSALAGHRTVRGHHATPIHGGSTRPSAGAVAPGR